MLSRTRSTAGDTPRTCTLASVPLDFRGNAAITTTSALTNGPRSDLAIPGASEITLTWSSETAPSISDVEPARRIIAFCVEPELTRVILNPRASDIMATKTETVPAIPRIATIAEVQRARTLRKL